jgi:hypothetical protein
MTQFQTCKIAKAVSEVYLIPCSFVFFFFALGSSFNVENKSKLKFCEQSITLGEG